MIKIHITLLIIFLASSILAFKIKLQDRSSLSSLQDLDDTQIEEEDSSQDSKYHRCASNILNIINQDQSFKQIEKRGQLWTDDSFPQQKALKGKYALYARASSKMKEVHIFGKDGIQASDIKQGFLGNCYLLAALAAMAQHPSYLKSVFLNGDNKAGVYATKWYIGGLPMVVMVDDYFPVSRKTGKWLYAKVVGDEQIWPMIIEKAWAKLAGSYRKTGGGLPQKVMHALTGAPAYQFSNTKVTEEKLFEIVNAADKNKYFMSTWTGITQCSGVADHHAYSLISVYKGVEGTDGQKYDILKIRNPWASQGWKGAFSDESELWREEDKEKYLVGAERGTFYMTISDYRRCFAHTSIAQVKEGYKISYKEFKNVSIGSQRFHKSKAESFFVMLGITPKRMVPGQDCQPPIKSVQYYLFKINGKDKKFIESKTRNGKIRIKNGEVGEYEVLVLMKWNPKISYLRSFVVNIYSQQENIKFYDVPKETCAAQSRVDFTLANGDPWKMSGTRKHGCSYLKNMSQCKKFGHKWRNQGMTGNDACGQCGGGYCPDE